MPKYLVNVSFSVMVEAKDKDSAATEAREHVKQYGSAIAHYEVRCPYGWHRPDSPDCNCPKD